MRIFPWAVLIAIGTGELAGADEAPVQLQDVIAIAVKQNRTLASAGVDVDIARAGVVQAAGQDDFLLDASGTYRNIKAQVVSGVPLQEPSFNDLTLEVDLTRPLSTGGTIGLRLLNDYSSTQYATDDGTGAGQVFSTTNTQAPSLQLVFTQPILRNAGKSVARAQQRKARVGEDIAELANEATAAATLRDVATAYYELVYATEELGILKVLASSARDQLAVVKANIDAGKMPPTASAEVIVTVGLRDEDVLVAEQDVLEKSLALRQLAGMPIGAGATMINAAGSADVDVRIPSLEGALDEAMTQNPQLLMARAQGRSAKIDVEVTENGLLPQLDFAISAGPTGSSDRFGDALSQTAKFDNYSIQASLTLHEALGHRAARGLRDAAVGQVRKARLSEEDIAAQIASSVVRLVALAGEAQRRVDVIAPTFEAATLDLAAERARFEVARSTNFDVLRRQDELAQTQLRQARAKVDLLEAMAALDAATGEILGKFGLSLHPRPR